MATIFVRCDDAAAPTLTFDTQAGGANAAPFGEGDVLLDISWSSLNYKDALCLKGDRGVARVSPLIPGIDAVGTVREAGPDSPVRPGQLVSVNGAGLGEFRHGGYTPQLLVPGEACVPVPEVFSAAQAAALGTAGYTAALCVLALSDHAVKAGPVVVTGASGGVGSIALHLLARLGYEPVALTGRAERFGDFLRGLGASEVLERSEFEEPSARPLQKARFAGGVDTVGGQVLANLLAQIRWGGTVAACGLAGGTALPTTVLPFILRGVTLAGVDSVRAPRELRLRAWELLAEHVDTGVLDSLTHVIELEEVPAAGRELLAGQRYGRTAVRVS
ncbi:MULTISPECIES: acrylyl-CoA reductase family protein [Actinotignum]|uniref:Acryloyl-CoA reductase n=2 Tax=Actinotignum timonense TaxID=1870995 RepID=A0AAW9HFG5_9ACTO|nr:MULTISPECIES: acryloyl-CoA reductase [Actinotignum]MDE1536604.1 acryloyl-CoA reductase [Actinotignum schaalii]MDE1558372.1 acryloyl-CoA reductase [Actinotignum schaalii]MDE1663164.1 acryloyl-CoA reductase [Actinotignum schaalii]MDK6372479.1 acryloyl-CoA reductase [Actinotignum timonense]MDK6419339.1 acryloyl-CoA reductase [Actinotignum timonense]